jgi:UDPglucose 6-dehydrogenase
MIKVAMIGVGKLGQDCAEVMAEQYNVVGYDIEPRSPAFPMCSTIQEAVTDRDIIFIAAPTPHDPMYGGETPTSHLPNKDFDYTIVTDILNEVNKHVERRQLVVLISTVLPGTVRRELRPCITNARFIYNPYLIAMGTTKWDFINPEMLIIGTEDGSLTGDASELINFYKPLMQNDPRIEVGTWDEAEAIKIFYNTFISTKLALVNMVQDVAERNGNMNVDVVTSALANSTYRIMGPAYMKAGLGDAGACHPRDNIALRYMAENLNLGYDLFDSIMAAREIQAENMALRCLKNGKNVTIIGKAYKPGVPYTNGSASMLIGHYIEKHGGNVSYYDLHTGDTDIKSDWTDVYLIGYWEKYVEDIKFPAYATVIDPWRRYNGPASLHYGNTRNKEVVVQPDNYHNWVKSILTSKLYPELVPYMDQSFFIYANHNYDFTLANYSNEAIVELIVDQYNKGSKYVFFECLAEPFANSLFKKINTIIDLVNEQVTGIKFFFLTGCANGETEYETRMGYINEEVKLQVISTRYFESGLSHYRDFSGPDYDAEKLRDKKYLSFNRMPRLHRCELLNFLLANNLLDDGFVSFGNYMLWRPDDHLMEVVQDFKHIKENLHILPLNINSTAERPNPADIQPQDSEFFDNSYFSIVTETAYYQTNHNGPTISIEKDIFPSEKIYKPIMMKHPFILMGRPYFLKTLRSHGYQTFHPYIDETYDTVENDAERMKLIFNEISRLAAFTDDQYREWMQQVKPIVEHNKRQMHTNSDYRVTKDVLKYFV